MERRIRTDRAVVAAIAALGLVLLLTVVQGVTFWSSPTGALNLLVIAVIAGASVFLRAGARARPLFRALAGILAIASLVVVGIVVRAAVISNQLPADFFALLILALVGGCYFGYCAVRGVQPKWRAS